MRTSHYNSLNSDSYTVFSEYLIDKKKDTPCHCRARLAFAAYDSVLGEAFRPPLPALLVDHRREDFLQGFLADATRKYRFKNINLADVIL